MNYIDDFPSCKSTYATLRIYPRDLHPSKVTDKLNINPSDCSVANSPPRAGRQKVNGWFLSTKGVIHSRDSRRHIDFLLDMIEPKSKNLYELTSEGAKIDISCYWLSSSGNGGPLISPSQMKRLADLNIEVWWDVWFEGYGESA